MPQPVTGWRVQCTATVAPAADPLGTEPSPGDAWQCNSVDCSDGRFAKHSWPSLQSLQSTDSEEPAPQRIDPPSHAAIAQAKQ